MALQYQDARMVLRRERALAILLELLRTPRMADEWTPVMEKVLPKLAAKLAVRLEAAEAEENR